MAFEVFKKGSAPISSVPSVTVQKRGLISMNRSAHVLIGAPEAVELLWDPDRKVIGIRPTDLSNPNAYPARAQGSKSERGPFLIAGALFAQYIGMDTTVAMRWVPTVEDDILCIDVSQPGQEATSNRGRRQKPTVVGEISSVTAAS